MIQICVTTIPWYKSLSRFDYEYGCHCTRFNIPRTFWEWETLVLQNILQHHTVDAINELIIIHRAKTGSQAPRYKNLSHWYNDASSSWRIVLFIHHYRATTGKVHAELYKVVYGFWRDQAVVAHGLTGANMTCVMASRCSHGVVTCQKFRLPRGMQCAFLQTAKLSNPYLSTTAASRLLETPILVSNLFRKCYRLLRPGASASPLLASQQRQKIFRLVAAMPGFPGRCTSCKGSAHC